MVRQMVAALFLSAGLAAGQSQIFKPTLLTDSATFWPNIDTLLVGGGFMTYTGFGTVTVTLQTNSAQWQGDLYAIDSTTGARVFLFNNYAPVGTSVNLNSVLTMAANDVIVFEYDVMFDPYGLWTPTVKDKYPKYTGPNKANGTYFSLASSDAYKTPNLRYGRCWSVMGKNKVTGKIVFGFEDNTSNTSSDMDFNDIIFNVSGLKRGVWRRNLASKSFVW